MKGNISTEVDDSKPLRETMIWEYNIKKTPRDGNAHFHTQQFGRLSKPL